MKTCAENSFKKVIITILFCMIGSLPEYNIPFNGKLHNRLSHNESKIDNRKSPLVVKDILLLFVNANKYIVIYCLMLPAL